MVPPPPQAIARAADAGVASGPTGREDRPPPAQAARAQDPGHKLPLPRGEADLIALDRSTRADLGAETIAFVEVKTLSGRQRAAPESAVNADKQRRLRRIAAYYLGTHPDAESLNVRFDVVAIVLNDPDKPQINYIPDAF